MIPIQKAKEEIKKWGNYYQGGNMWSAWDCYLTAARDILGLKLKSHAAYSSWESLAKLGGFRFMHSKFCMVTAFPEIIKTNEIGQPHNESGPSHQWPDGWSLWHINGVRVDEQIVMQPETQTIQQIHSEQNGDVRSVRIDRFGWTRYLKETNSKEIDINENDVDGTIEALYVTPDGSKKLVVPCPTGRLFCLGVPKEIKTCVQAQNWLRPRKVQSVART
jgi:hypothetical protein